MMAKMVTDDNNLFINPYNFVSGFSRDYSAPDEKEQNLCGYISCSLKVKNALAVPDRNAEDPDSKRCFDFYKVNGKPVIPGSEIRGCIRSVFEALTNSCYLTTDDAVLSARLPKPKQGIKNGIMLYDNKSSKWLLCEAIYRDSNRKKLSKGNYTRQWRSAASPKPETFHCDKGRGPGFPVDDKQLNLLDKEYDLYLLNNEAQLEKAEKELKNAKTVKEKAEAQELVNNYKEFSKVIKQQKKALKEKNGPVFVFYEKNDKGDFVYFSCAYAGRSVFARTLYSLLPAKPCTGSKLCPACSLFGTITSDDGNEKGISKATRIRFTDAVTENADLIDGYWELPELSSPKLSNMEFYAIMEGYRLPAERWTYDSGNVKLRGRKFYFHSKPQYEEKADFDVPERQIAVRVCRAGDFNFRLYFDKVSESELRQLCWALTIGENNRDGSKCHKLGTGKSVGFGSIKITLDDIVFREVKNGEYIIKKAESVNDYIVAEGFDKAAKADIEIISNYNLLDGFKVSYPIADNGTNDADHDAGYQWFTANRSTRKNQFSNKYEYTFTQVLPKLSGEPKKMALKAMKSDGYVIGHDYTATVGTTYKNGSGKEYTNITVNGKRESVPAFKIPKGVSEGDEVTVHYKRLIMDRYPDFDVFIKR